MRVLKSAGSVFLPASLIASLAASLAVAAGGAGAGDAGEGKDTAILCAACHGLDGISEFPAIPHLAGQQEAYLISQMKDFRRTAKGQTGSKRRQSRHDVVMDHQAARLGDADMENLAAYFSGLPCRLRAAASGPMPKRAGRCVSCHGRNGVSDTPTVPHLAGQQERYLENQLRAFRDQDVKAGPGKKRRDRHHWLMDRQVKVLGDKELSVLARYFAGRACR